MITVGGVLFGIPYALKVGCEKAYECATLPRTPSLI
jgi:hypothetical protein